MLVPETGLPLDETADAPDTISGAEPDQPLQPAVRPGREARSRGSSGAERDVTRDDRHEWRALRPHREADEYFATRPRESQIGAWASIQSQPIEHATDLANRISEVEERFDGKDIPRPPFWSGFRLRPERIEFWKARPGRLHERHLYTRSGENWVMETLYP